MADYCTIANLTDAKRVEILGELTTGSPTPDNGMIGRVITAQSAFIDGYLAKRYSLPLSAPLPGILAEIAVRLVVRALYARGHAVPKEVQTEYESAVKALESIASGAIELPIGSAPTSASTVAYTDPYEAKGVDSFFPIGRTD